MKEETVSQRAVYDMIFFPIIFYISLKIPFTQFSLSNARKARPARTKAAASRNPLKSLAKRQDLQDEYKEVNTGVAQKEMKRVKREEVGMFPFGQGQ